MAGRKEVPPSDPKAARTADGSRTLTARATWGTPPSLTAEENLEADARLLERALPASRVAVLRDTALTLGVAQKTRTPAVDRARTSGIPILRRTTGGTAVLTGPGDVAWSIVLPRGDPRVGRDYVTAYDRFGAAVTTLLREVGIVSAWTPGPDVAPEVCLLSGRGRVVVVHGRVAGGAAQHRSARALLHHGFLMRQIDRPLLRRLFDLPRESESRLTCGEEYGWPSPSEEVAARLDELLDLEIRGLRANGGVSL